MSSILQKLEPTDFQVYFSSAEEFDNSYPSCIELIMDPVTEQASHEREDHVLPRGKYRVIDGILVRIIDA